MNNLPIELDKWHGLVYYCAKIASKTLRNVNSIQSDIVMPIIIALVPSSEDVKKLRKCLPYSDSAAGRLSLHLPIATIQSTQYDDDVSTAQLSLLFKAARKALQGALSVHEQNVLRPSQDVCTVSVEDIAVKDTEGKLKPGNYQFILNAEDNPSLLTFKDTLIPTLESEGAAATVCSSLAFKLFSSFEKNFTYSELGEANKQAIMDLLSSLRLKPVVARVDNTGCIQQIYYSKMKTIEVLRQPRKQGLLGYQIMLDIDLDMTTLGELRELYLLEQEKLVTTSIEDNKFTRDLDILDRNKLLPKDIIFVAERCSHKFSDYWVEGERRFLSDAFSPCLKNSGNDGIVIDARIQPYGKAGCYLGKNLNYSLRASLADLISRKFKPNDAKKGALSEPQLTGADTKKLAQPSRLNQLKPN